MTKHLILSGAIPQDLGVNPASLDGKNVPPGWHRLGNSTTAIVIGGEKYYIKLYAQSSAVLSLVRVGLLPAFPLTIRAMRAAANERRLARQGVSVPETLTVGTVGSFSYQITRTVQGERLSNRINSLDESERLQLMYDVAGVLAKIHGAGVAHGDFHLGNLIKPALSQSDLVLIDNEKNKGQWLRCRGAFKKDIRTLLRERKGYRLCDKEVAAFMQGYEELIVR